MPRSQNRFFSWLILVGTGALFGLLIPVLIDYIVTSGHFIGSADIGSDYFRALLWSLALGFVLVFLPFPKEVHKYVLWLWFARCLVTLGFMLFYEKQYDLDAYEYFRKSLAMEAYSSAGEGTRFINWLGWNVNKYVPFTNSYHTLKVFWSFAGLIGAYYFYKTILLFSQKQNLTLLLVLGMYPSMIFWSSILGKDPLTFLGTALCAYGGLGFLTKKNLHFFLFALAGFFLVMTVRFWLVGFMTFAIVATALLRSRLPSFQKWAFSLMTCAALFSVIQISSERWNLSSSEDVVERVDKFSKGWSHGGSAQEIPSFDSPVALALFIPQGVFTSLFRPLPGEVSNVFGWLNGFENLLLLWGLFYTLSVFRRDYFRDPLIFFLITFILSWSVVYGFISSQNLGTAVRYKLQVLPFMLMLPFYIRSKRQEEATPMDTEMGTGKSHGLSARN